MEVLVSIISSSIVIAGVYQIFHAHQNSYLYQDESIKMIQSLRAGIYQISKDIRSAGYNPTRGTYFSDAISKENIGFVQNFEYDVFRTESGGNETGRDSGPIDYSIDTTKIAFTLDKDGDGRIEDDNLNGSSYPDVDGTGSDENYDDENGEDEYSLYVNRDDGARGEKIAYRLFDNKLQRFNSERYAETRDLNKSWETLVSDVEILNFVFLDNNGDKFSGSNNNLNDIKSVEITLIVRSGSKNHNRNTNFLYRNRQGDIICEYCSSSKYRYKIFQSRVNLRNRRGYDS